MIRTSAIALACLASAAAHGESPGDWRLVSGARVTDVRAALAAYRADEPSAPDLAEQFGVDAQTLGRLANGRAERLEFVGPAGQSAGVMRVALSGDGPANQLLQAEGPIVPLPGRADRFGMRRDGWLYLGAHREPIAAAARVEAIGISECLSRALPPIEQETDGWSTAFWADLWTGLERLAAGPTASERQREALAHALRHGLTSIEAVAGAARFPEGDLATGSAFVLAPKPRPHSLALLTTSPTDDLAAPAWLAGAAEEIVLLHADVPAAFRRMDRVFDDLLAEGIDGTYRELLTDLADEQGLGVDLESDLYPLLGPRVFIARGPYTTDAQGRSQAPALFVFQTDHADDVAQVFRRLMAPDEGVTFLEWPGRGEGWRVDSDEGPQPCLATVDGFAVYATDVGLLDSAIDEPSREKRERYEQLNLRLRGLAGRHRPSIAVVRLAKASDLAGSARAAQRHAAEAFFEGPALLEGYRHEGPLALLQSITNSIADPIILGFEATDGWEFRAAGTLDADPTTSN
ncbi:hypothetical protein [Botrimarina sp.]|uniref:hypothetical protein n=1 Tax=Botrimarina sp. TaxID=2795802 RepID=UPI0032ED8BAF